MSTEQQQRAEVMLKPSRSEILSPLEQEYYLKKAQEYFAEAAPRRTSKPRRSESDDDVRAMVAVPTEIPELKVLAQMRANGQVILAGTATVADADEHEESGYYKGREIGAEHATLGTGFIPLGVKQEVPYKSDLQAQHQKLFQELRCNPATNEWTPEAAKFVANSGKPGRSEQL